MVLRASILLLMGAGIMITPQKGTRNEELARRLADGDHVVRQGAVAQVVASAPLYVPLLLSWTENPPPEVKDTQGLCMGMAEVFGELKTKEAIPFLIKNISCGLFYAGAGTWMKGAAAIESRLPAVAALIKIGPDASKALTAYSEPMTEDDRLAVIFTVGRIGDPNARRFLNSAIATAETESYWAKEGLKLLNGNR